MADFYSTFLNIYCMNVDNAHSIGTSEQPLLQYYRFKKIGGRAAHQRFTLNGSRAFSGSFAGGAAMAANGSASGNHFEWQVPTGTLFDFIRVAHRDIALSENDNDAAARAAQYEMDGGTKEFAQGLVRKMLGSAGARIGTALFDVDATNGCPTFSLQFTDPSVVKNIQLGDHVVITASTDDGTESNDVQIGSPGYCLEKDDEIGYVRVATISAINTPANPGSWVDNTTYSVFRQGELQPGDVTSQLISWATYITATKATTSVANVNRNLHSGLSGVRVPAADPAAAGALLGRVKRHLAIMANRAGMSHKAIVLFNPEDFDSCSSQQEVAVRRESGKKSETGYMSITVNSALGPVDLVSEAGQPKGEYLILDPDECELHTANGKLYQIIVPPGGSPWQLLEGSNTVEARATCYNRHFCGIPYHHGRGSTL